MAKVIVERPRHGWRIGCRKGYGKRWQKCDPADWPKRESIYARGGRTKSFNEHLSPLKRFLEKQAGRPWNKVFAEICERLRVDSVIQGHVRDHIDDFVETQVIEIDGVLCRGQGWGRGRPLAGRWGPLLYVCPRTGLLRKVKKWRRVAKTKPREVVHVCATREYRLMDGIWYEVALRPIGTDSTDARDIVLKKTVGQITRWDAMEEYGAHVYAASRRQLNKREIRKLGLRNQ